MTKQYFCTLFDSGYLLKGLVMMQSLKEHCPNAHVFILCMDEKSQTLLEQLNYSYITCIALAKIETDELLDAKKSRGVAEYCWTLSPCLPWYIFENFPEIQHLTYLDADLMFYSPVAPLFEEIGDKSIAIIEHRFTPRLKDREVNGRFCVEWVSFKRDEEGMACLKKWRDQCIEWCYYRLEDGRMGDQKYLDEWPDLYPSCHILMHEGAGIAPWNYAQYQFSLDDNKRIMVNDHPVIFYHFHQFQLLKNGDFDRLSTFYTSECEEPKEIYRRYEQALISALQEVRQLEPKFSDGLKASARVTSRRWAQKHIPHSVKNILRKVIRF